MSYVAKWFFRDGRTAHETAPFATREDADNYAKTLNTAKGYTYTIEEVPDVSTAAVLDASPSVGVMPRRVWQEQRIRALGEAIVRRMGREEPKVATAFDLAHVRDWAAEIVELCERNSGRQAKPNNAEAIRMLEVDNRDLRDRLAVARRQRDEAVAALAKDQKP